MKKKFLFLMTLLAVSLLALAEMTVYVYQKDGTKVEYLAANVDSIGFANVFTITFDANGGDGSMDVVKIKEGETITLPDNTFTKGSSTFVGWNTQADGTGTAYADKASATLIANLTLYAQWEAQKDTGIADGHEWVDLGLPSGTKWATCNVGATLPEEYGAYFAWGEIESKSDFTEVNYVYEDVPEVLPISADAANVNWGGSWRMPTDNDVKELNRNTKLEFITYNGVECVKIISNINGSSILVPRVEADCLFWTSNGSYMVIGHSEVVWRGHVVSFYDDKLSIPVTAPYYGRPIRPVLP